MVSKTTFVFLDFAGDVDDIDDAKRFSFFASQFDVSCFGKMNVNGNGLRYFGSTNEPITNPLA